MLTILVLLFAQAHFERPHMPSGKEWVTQKRAPLKCAGDFVMPLVGQHTIRYAHLVCEGNVKPPQDYKDTPVAPQFCDRKECRGNKEPIYVVDESYDHIIVRAKAGTHWWYTVLMAVPK